MIGPRPYGMLLAALLAAAPVVATRGESRPTNLVVVSWNVENLFDSEDDPANPGDDEYTSAGWTRWTPQRYRLKLEHLAEAIGQMAPDVLFVAEVENRRVLADLADELQRQHGWTLPHLVHRDGEDQRGIDTALMARYEPAKVEWLTPVSGQRNVLVADFEIGGAPFTLIGNHWKSNYGDRRQALEIRGREARFVRKLVEARLARHSGAALLVAGDFNDDVDAPVLAEAGFGLTPAAVFEGQMPLFNLSAGLSAERRGSYYYAQAKRWNSFDSMSVSAGMLEGCREPSPWQVKAGTYAIFSTPAMRTANGAPLPFRRIGTANSQKVFSGYADHFPVRVVLEAVTPASRREAGRRQRESRDS